MFAFDEGLRGAGVISSRPTTGSPRLTPAPSESRKFNFLLMQASSSSRFVKMSTLARLSGVPAATIKHYLREGLLPHAEVKTGRNMAFYDPLLSERIKRIKTLQREQFLPLRVIKSVLEGQPSAQDDAEAAKAIERALASMAPPEARTRSQLLTSGVREEDLAFFESLGLVTARNVEGRDTFSGDDLTLLRLLGTSRRAGITKQMLPADIVEPYVHAIRELVRIELEMFRRGVIPRAGKDLAKITDAATRLSEQLVILIRRKMLLPILDTLVTEHTGSVAAARTTKPGRRPATRLPARGRKPSKAIS